MNRSLIIDGIHIHDASDAYVIAEIGHNHQGSVEKAEKMISAAKESGASAVKLQKRDNRTLFTEEVYNKPYENENSFGSTYGEHREALEFGKAAYEQLINFSKSVGITLFATAFDMPSVHFLADLEMPAYKVASGDLKNTPLIRAIAKVGKPMIISTGGGTMEDVRRAYAAAREFNEHVALLQCTSAYPVNFEEMDLNVITTYREEFPEAVIGLSGHDNGIAMSVAAYMLGARIVEKHFTLDRAMKGTDHAFSLEPLGLKKMVRDLNRVRVACGSTQKRVFASEQSALQKMGKQLVAARDLPTGHRITPADIAIKSPGGGIPPYALDLLIGQTIIKPLKKDEAFRMEYFPVKEKAELVTLSRGRGK